MSNEWPSCLVVVVLVAHLTLATPITYVNQTFTSAMTITTPYDIITLTDVTFSGAFDVQIQIGDIAAAATFPLYLNM
jgi:hypothetical protein